MENSFYTVFHYKEKKTAQLRSTLAHLFVLLCTRHFIHWDQEGQERQCLRPGPWRPWAAATPL